MNLFKIYYMDYKIKKEKKCKDLEGLKKKYSLASKARLLESKENQISMCKRSFKEMIFIFFNFLIVLNGVTYIYLRMRVVNKNICDCLYMILVVLIIGIGIFYLLTSFKEYRDYKKGIEIIEEIENAEKV